MFANETIDVGRMKEDGEPANEIFIQAAVELFGLKIMVAKQFESSYDVV